MIVRRATLLAALAAACLSGRPAAQVSFHAGAGLRYTSTLAHDSIVQLVDLRPALAPTLVLAVQDALGDKWTADATLDLSHSGLRRHEGGASFDAGSFTAVAFTVGLARQVAPALTGRFGVGALRYLSSETGVFRDGSGGLFPLPSLAFTYAPPFAARGRLSVEARYDLHQFNTPALRSVGFTAARPVHRIALLVSMRAAP